LKLLYIKILSIKKGDGTSWWRILLVSYII